MKKVVVASTNPVKRAVAEIAFSEMFPDEVFEFESVKAASGISDQPLSDVETLTGAMNRITDAKRLSPGADFYLSLEGGAEDVAGELQIFAWIVVESKDGKIGKGRSAAFIAPPEMRRLVVVEGKEVGPAADIMFHESNSKQKMGAIGLLTNGVIDRTEMYRHAAAYALLPFVQPDLY